MNIVGADSRCTSCTRFQRRMDWRLRTSGLPHGYCRQMSNTVVFGADRRWPDREWCREYTAAASTTRS
jgi:hypothetical protein